MIVLEFTSFVYQLIIEIKNIIKFNNLSQLFRENCNTEKTLVVFQSASGPGSIERDFIRNLGPENQNIEVATAFRTDWSIETFMGKTSPQIVASNEPLISEELKDFSH